jgi:DNA helicase HerA-like ATPase
MKGSGKSFLVQDIVRDYHRVIAIDSMGEYENEIIVGLEAGVRRIVQASREREFRISLRTDSVEQDLQLMKVAGTLSSFLIVVEETSKYVSAYGMPEPIENMIRYGRHRDISQIYMARRPSEINRDLTANADVIVTFREQEPRDVAYLRGFMGAQAFKVPNLPEYHCEVWGTVEKMPLSVIERMEP